MKLENLTVRYDGFTILDGMNLSLPDSGMTCFFAPSGTGKTTILKVLCGLLRPESGRVTGLEGKEFACVFQEDRLIEGLSVRDNVGLVLDRAHQQLAGEYLAALGLAGWENALPGELSGGMRRRAAIARALAFGEMNRGRTVYLLDEPLKGLDEQAAKSVIEFIKKQTAGEMGFLVTHDRVQANELADLTVCFEGRPMRVTELIYKEK